MIVKVMQQFSSICRFVYAAIFVSVLSCSVYTQQGQTHMDATPSAQSGESEHRSSPRVGLFKILGLTKEQIDTVRKLNKESRPLEFEARKRFNQANHLLSLAIYSDNISETDYEARLKEYQTAQAELTRIRFAKELQLRKILTPEQLTRFREMRSRFVEQREKVGPPNDEGRPRVLKMRNHPPRVIQ